MEKLVPDPAMAEEMRDKQEPRHGQANKSTGRNSANGIMAVQLLFAIILLFSLNYLSGSHHTAWDLSQDNEFSLSNQTQKLLTSDLLDARTRPVRLIAAVRRNSAHYSRLHAMLEEYKRLAHGALTIEFVDYVRDSDTALEIADQYGTTFVEDVIIIDAVPSLSLAPPDDPQAKSHAQKTAALRRTHIRYVAVEDMLVFASDKRQNRRLIGYQDEDQLTAAIRRAIEGTPRRFYFLADKSQIAGPEEDAPWTFLTRTFDSLNIKLIPRRISDLEKIPDDAAGVALIAPRFDLNARELAIFREYWDRPRAAVLVVLDPTRKQQPPNLRAFLREHGVTPREVRLSTTQGTPQTFDVAATFTNATAVGDLRNASTLFEGASAALDIRENSEDLELRQINPLALITANKNVRARPLDGSPAIPGPHYLAASISRGNERNDTTAEATSRMIVVSNSDFLQPRSRHREHIDFLRNTSNWLIGREELIGIGPRPVQYYKLLLPSRKVSFVNKLNLFFIPGAFILAALFIWNTRRV